MNTKRILISVNQRLSRQLISYSLKRYSDVEIVGRSLNAIRIMSLIAQRKPHLWIHSFEDGPDYARIWEYIRSIAPEIAILRVNPDNPMGYLELPLHSIDDLVSQALLFNDNKEALLTTNSTM
jgi:DNA-binding NarL/FixJ family response regulator